MRNWVVVLISADAEWEAVLRKFPHAHRESSPFGQWFHSDIQADGLERRVVFFHGGWGKIAAAASTQYVVDRWSPTSLVNLGTCGGFAGEVEVGAILLVERTLVYDIVEQICDPAEAIAHYTTELDLSWLEDPLPMTVRRSLLVSADRDLIAAEIPYLKREFGAIAGDWESGAIAYVASRNKTGCLILRSVSDLVGTGGGEVYNDRKLWVDRTEAIMAKLVDSLPAWIGKTCEQKGAQRGAKVRGGA